MNQEALPKEAVDEIWRIISRYRDDVRFVLLTLSSRTSVIPECVKIRPLPPQKDLQVVEAAADTHSLVDPDFGLSTVVSMPTA